jgi:hypothetical protein
LEWVSLGGRVFVVGWIVCSRDFVVFGLLVDRCGGSFELADVVLDQFLV